MSATERAARALKTLKDEEWKVLFGLEKAAKTQGSAVEGKVARLSRLPPDRARFALDALEKKGLARGKGTSHVLNREGIEALALRHYVGRDLLYALGAIIAKGKESDVYEAVNEEGSVFALKFFKLGRVSFTQVRKKRFTEVSEIRTWMSINYEAARREHSALSKLAGMGPTFPKVYSHNRNTVLLEHVSGVRLSERPELLDPKASLKQILGAVRTAYSNAGLVNGDLSEYNILTDGGAVWLIDWPQAVERNHPNAEDLLRHDVDSVVKFFKRAYGVDQDLTSAFEYVTGRVEVLE